MSTPRKDQYSPIVDKPRMDEPCGRKPDPDFDVKIDLKYKTHGFDVTVLHISTGKVMYGYRDFLDQAEELVKQLKKELLKKLKKQDRERSIEKYFCKAVKAIGGKTFKMVPTFESLPDRAVIWKGITYYVELKRSEKTEARKLQLKVMEELRAHGAYAEVIGSRKQVDEFILMLKSK